MIRLASLSWFSVNVQFRSNVTGITFPSGDAQKQLLLEMYREAGVDPRDVTYVEAHGTGTRAGDPQELNAIADVFCGKERKQPLLIGSTKSNMGHPEGASGANLDLLRADFVSGARISLQNVAHDSFVFARNFWTLQFLPNESAKVSCWGRV